ncbi:hypothetical protein FHR83_002018 [Actinoplanes campanulatus]|uniref:Uncharacterized protein n=1 Tax=Actinoplanes campanulatus TaxID=113559 RepID=A0A7W5ADM3_9ACTN|nr:hypothetical protein [Actinoplanes campanulatus]
MEQTDTVSPRRVLVERVTWLYAWAVTPAAFTGL